LSASLVGLEEYLLMFVIAVARASAGAFNWTSGITTNTTKRATERKRRIDKMDFDFIKS